mgnify:CR=1 FL=1
MGVLGARFEEVINEIFVNLILRIFPLFFR